MESVSFNTFNLDARLMRAITDAGYTQPTPIQQAAIPVAMNRQDIVGTAQTGTGKTAAFVLPILQKILTDDEARKTDASPQPASGNRRPASRHRALIVTPTRELAEQINDNIRACAKYTKIRSATIYGGVGPGPQERSLRDGVEILICCPGRMLDHIDGRMAKLDSIDTLVLDEADRMFDMGFLPQIRRILQHVPKQRQTMLFSATFPKAIEELAASCLNSPKRVSIGLSQPAHTVTHALYPVASHLKKKLLIALLRKTDAFSMLVFTRTKHRAEALAQQLDREGFKTTSLHSDRSQGQRQKALDGFKSGKYQVMVATDIAARGLDVETVSHVINYDIPDTVDAYIHRIGRTGRAQREGDAFTLISPEDNEMVRDIERAMKKKITRETLADFDYNAAAPERTSNGAPQSPRSGPPQRFQRDRNSRQAPAPRFTREPSRAVEPTHAAASNEPSVAHVNSLLEKTSSDVRRSNDTRYRRPQSASSSDQQGRSENPQGARAPLGAPSAAAFAGKRRPLQRSGSKRVYLTRDERNSFG